MADRAVSSKCGCRCIENRCFPSSKDLEQCLLGETREGEGGGVANTPRELGFFQDAGSVRDYVRSASLIKWRRGLTACLPSQVAVGSISQHRSAGGSRPLEGWW